MIPFYDVNGIPVAYVERDGENICRSDGVVVGRLVDRGIYSCRGELLGGLVDGWVYDREGNWVFFTTEATGVAGRPRSHPRSDRTLSVSPFGGTESVVGEATARLPTWSPLSGPQFFSLS